MFLLVNSVWAWVLLHCLMNPENKTHYLSWNLHLVHGAFRFRVKSLNGNKVKHWSEFSIYLLIAQYRTGFVSVIVSFQNSCVELVGWMSLLVHLDLGKRSASYVVFSVLTLIKAAIF